ncbi:MAG: hypothetical protein MJ188_07945 [Treponema sp.]|nr:hypothetical protein [Treponema sp.]
MIKKSFFVLVFFIFSFSLFGQQQLNSINASWTHVIPGKVVSKPQSFSQGFGIITDARNLMIFSNMGKLIWEKRISNFSSPFFHFLPKDFIFLVSDSGKKMTLLNCDGQELWTRKSDFPLTQNVLPGRDGRFFVRGKNNLMALSIYGNIKWSIETPEQNNLDLQELSDGSLILFLAELDNHKTKALRVTPFGEIIEEITFAGEVLKAVSVPSGVLLTFTDGTSGLFDLNKDENRAEHKWLFQNNLFTESKKSQIDTSQFVISQNQQDVIYLNPLEQYLEICYIDIKTGDSTKSFLIQKLNKLIFTSYNDNGILLCDSENAVFYNNSGKLIWSGAMPQKGSREFYNYLLFTRDNHFVLFGSNWSINAFRTSQRTAVKEKNVEKQNALEYKSYFDIDSAIYAIENTLFINKSVTDSSRTEILKNGNYGKIEAEWFTELYAWCELYKRSLSSSNSGGRVDKSIFQTDTVNVEKIIRQLPNFETTNITDALCYYLKKESNTTLLHAILISMSENCYDPDYKMLQAIQYLLTYSSPKEDFLLCDICNAVYEICRFNGIDSINAYGKTILTEMMYPKYSSVTRNYARDTLKKIVR